VIDARALIVARTRAYPRGEALRGWERRGGRPDLGDDLLRRIYAQARHGRQALHGILMDPEQTREYLVQLGNLLFDQSQFVQRHLEQSPVHRIEVVHAPNASHN